MDLWGKSDKLAVLHIANTGHVLGAATRLGAGEEKPSVAQLAGAAMEVAARDPVSGDRFATRVTRDLLAMSLVDFDEQALRAPPDFVLSDKAVSLPTLTVQSVKLTAASRVLTILLGTPVTEDMEVYFRADGPRTIERAVPGKPSTTVNGLTVRLADPLNTGETFDVMVAVAGHGLFFKFQLAVV